MQRERLVPTRPLRPALRPLLTAALCASATLGAPARAFDCAEGGNWLEHQCARASLALKEGRHDLYLPFHAHHGRDTYTPQRIAELNEDALGIGYGRSVTDQHNRWLGDWHGVYVMGFRDSHYKLQTMAGYAWQSYIGTGQFKLGLGYTAFLTSRRDIAGGFPVPAVLPMGSLNYGNASLMAAYVPRLSGKQGNGDVLFLFGHYSY